ncbi:homeobox-leucine zipper protein HOX27-like [Cryptomeria japonica]|uniref:homeobox-leucine zipper protein HOX27-like n=1 Tax=Cryptomeria japonica TaxID=3369 RepID=UPI0027DAACBF|nr:homeobox-leucine zipper protein HOX27-like [Cryptomeria japonica]
MEAGGGVQRQAAPEWWIGGGRELPELVGAVAQRAETGGGSGQRQRCSVAIGGYGRLVATAFTDENSEVCSPNSLDLNKPLPSNEVGDFEKHFNVENGSLRNNNEKEKDGIKRRLKLSGEQYAYLEGCFKQNTNVDDEALAKELNISPRQVYVWFQNIKARNKSKQIKTHCNLWKRYNKALREENKSLRKKLAEISALKQAQETPSLKLGL